MTSGILNKTLIVISVAALLVGCSNSLKREQGAVVTKAEAQQVASIAQRPSENIHDARGRVTRTGEVYLLRGRFQSAEGGRTDEFSKI